MASAPASVRRMGAPFSSVVVPKEGSASASDGPGENSAGQRLRRHERLRSQSDFQRCYRRGRRIRSGHLAVHYVSNQEQSPRIGITVTRKVGTAVVRNRLKRQAREIYRQWPNRRQLPNLDLVVHFQPQAARAGYARIERELCAALNRLTHR